MATRTLTRAERSLRGWLVVVVVGSTLFALFIGGVLTLWVGTMVACQTLFPPSNPAVANGDAVVAALRFDEASRSLTGKVEKHYGWDDDTPVVVTVTARTPGEADARCVVTTRCGMTHPTTSFTIPLTAEQAEVFNNPEAKRTVSLRRADGQLVQDERGWPRR